MLEIIMKCSDFFCSLQIFILQTNFGELIRLLKEESLFILFPTMPDIGEISISPSGVDIDVLWRIDNFFHLSKNDGAVYLSPDFSYGGGKWYLEIYPNGRSRNDTYGHVDVRLWKKFPGFFRYHFSDSPPISQAFSLSLKTVKGEKVHEKHCTNDFCGMDGYHDCNRFIPRLELSRRRAELVPDGVLTVLCTMRNRTSAGSASKSSYPG